MFNRKPQTKSALDDAIDELITSLRGLDVLDDKYTSTVESIDTLMKLRSSTATERVSKDTLAIVAANLAGIVLVLEYEHARALSSKALTFIMKAR